MHPDTKKFLLPAGMILMASVIFAGAAVYLVRGMSHTHLGQAQAGQEAAQGAVLPPGAPNPSDSLPHYASSVMQFSGTIVSIGAQSITFKQMDGSTLTAEVNADTKLYQEGALKDKTAYAQELKDFGAKAAYGNSSEVFVAPSPNVETPVTLSDLKVGMIVSLFADPTDLKAVLVQVTEPASVAQ